MTASQLHHAFAGLLHAHRGIVHKVAAMYSRTHDDREDLAQEIVTQAWRSFGRYDAERAKFSTWLYRIALNVAISQVRRERGPPPGCFEPLDATHADTLLGGTPVPETDERLTALHGFIGQLDALNRALILLYLEGRSYAEIADVLGISETNVATKFGRIKQKLRGQMLGAATTGA